MKALRTYLGILLLLGFTACKQPADPSQACNCDNAAMEVYCKYASNEHLTVAYLGDFAINGKEIDAVMIQANDDSEWELLRQDFDLKAVDPALCDSLSNCSLAVNPDDNRMVSVGVGIDLEMIEESNLDNFTDKSQVPEETVDKIANNIAEKILNVMAGFQVPDSIIPDAAVVVGGSTVDYENESITTDNYIAIISRTLAENLIDEYFAERDSLIAADSQAEVDMLQGDELLGQAQSHGHSGYITAADHNNHTVWLFFYDNQEECNNILTHIREDIIITE